MDKFDITIEVILYFKSYIPSGSGKDSLLSLFTYMFHNVRQSLLLNKAKLTNCTEIISQHVLVPAKLTGTQKLTDTKRVGGREETFIEFFPVIY